MVTGLERVMAMTRRRWCVPIITHLHRRDGAKFVTLCHRLEGNSVAVRQSLDYLIELGWVERNTGYGHPLRPEYVLTKTGSKLAPACSTIDRVLLHGGEAVRAIGLRRWTLPMMRIIGERGVARFSDFAEELKSISPRALSMSLREMVDQRLLARRVAEAMPLRADYALDRVGEPLAEVLMQF